MKKFPVLLMFAIFLIAYNSKLPASIFESGLTSQINSSQPVLFIKSLFSQQGIQGVLDENGSGLVPNSLSTNVAAVKWTEVSFDNLAPRGMKMKECWNAMGIDDKGRIYIGFTSVRADGRDDFSVFRYDPKTGARLFLGSFLDIVASADNAQKGENIPKGHTRMVYANSRMYMGSQSFHDLKMEIDSLPTYRGSHLFAFNTIAGAFKDLSASLPGGVVTEHEGILSLNILPKEHLLVGLSHPSSDIILYDYQTEKLVKVAPGIPWELGNPLSREVIIAPSGNIYTYRGTEEVDQLNESHSVWVYNIHSGEMKDTGFQITKGFWIGQTQKRDGSKIYINTAGGELYEFDVASETFKDLGYELPKTDNRIINYTYALTLSPDETKLYYVPSIIQKTGGAAGSGKMEGGELYYYDIATGQVVFVQQLPVGIYTSADVRDSQNIYFAHFGSEANIWTGQPKLFILHVPSEPVAAFSKLDLYANIETVGVVVSGANLPKTAQLMVQRDGETVWKAGHPLVKIDDGRLVGSLFGLSPATSYNIKVIDGTTEISGSIITQPDELQFTPTTVLYVDDDASTGGDGSKSKPFKTIQEGVTRAAAGTQVLVADGVYHETVSFPASGAAGNWIQVKAEGSGAILDGSKTLSGDVWKPYRKGVWFTSISPSIKYLARDGQRYYMYDNLTGLLQGRGHNKVAMSEGWYIAPNSATLYVRSLDNPSNHSWQVPDLNHAMDADGRNWIWIEGFEIQYYGTTDSCGICLKNSSHVVIRKNKIHNLQLGIFINWTGSEDQGNDTRIEYNEIYDPPVNEWPWKAVKATSMEGTAIVVRGHIGAIVRGNEIHNFFNGIYTGSSAALENPAVAFDVDVYDNNIHHISDDALEPEGACINHRFRDNTIDTTLVGISLAPITQGPTWVLRSSFTNYTGSSIKWDLHSDGVVLIYHNTSWTNAKNLNAMSMIHPVYNSVMRNNIFQGNGFAFEEPFTGSTGHDWNNDNWYTTRGPNDFHFKWETRSYKTIAELCAATGLECKGYEDAPGLVNAEGGDFALLASSPNVDRGVVIPGINEDFKGNAPDIGAYESGFDLSPVVVSLVRVDENPTSAATVNFKVNFSEAVSGVDTSDFALVISGSLTDASVTSVSGSDNAYVVSVNTGNQDGAISLSVKDDDSIVDMAGNSLGGAGFDNGNFTSDGIYTVIKSTPITITTTSFISNKVNDGWVIESSENSNQGGGVNSISDTLYLGDNAEDRQFRTILDFITSALPDNAVMISATLEIKKISTTGTDPFTTHQNILVDINNGPFGVSALRDTDFQAAASMDSAGTIFNTPVDNWFSTVLDKNALQYINTTGSTQFRLRFQVDDNDDLGADTIKFYSGNSVLLNYRPILKIEYYVPQ
jgi:hypothetical protein